jgi:hypothetical protein
MAETKALVVASGGRRCLHLEMIEIVIAPAGPAVLDRVVLAEVGGLLSGPRSLRGEEPAGPALSVSTKTARYVVEIST